MRLESALSVGLWKGLICGGNAERTLDMLCMDDTLKNGKISCKKFKIKVKAAVKVKGEIEIARAKLFAKWVSGKVEKIACMHMILLRFSMCTLNCATGQVA